MGSLDDVTMRGRLSQKERVSRSFQYVTSVGSIGADPAGAVGGQNKCEAGDERG